jgi:hypothetical protein
MVTARSVAERDEQKKFLDELLGHILEIFLALFLKEIKTIELLVQSP